MSEAPRHGAHADAPSLYEKMLPLIEAGASVEQAARRFGDEDDVEEIAAGFARWLERERDADEDASDAARIAVLEDANERLRAALAECRRAIAAAQEALREAEGGGR